MHLKNSLLFVLLAIASVAYGQRDTAAVNKLVRQSRSLTATDSAKAVDLAMEAKTLAIELKYPKGEADALKYLGMVYYQRGLYVQTLGYWNQSLQIFEKIPDNVGIANMLSNIGAIYFNQGADDKALEYSLKSLQMAEKLGDTLRMVSTLTNIGSIYHDKKDPVALTYLLKAVPLMEKTGDKDAYVVLTGNIGELYFDNNNNEEALAYYRKSIAATDSSSEAAFSYNGIGKVYLRQGDFEQALENHNKALRIAEAADDKFQVVRGLRGIADVYEKKNNIGLALEYYQKARIVAEGMDDVKVELKDLYNEMSDSYAKNNDFPNAYLYKSQYSDLKDTLFNIETKKKLNQLQFDFELSKKQGEIVLNEAKIRSEKQARIALTAGLGLLLIFAFFVYRNYLQKARINKILDKQKVQIENLLLNILPKQVAAELQASGNSKPRHFEQVSVLFTDFKGFTSIADKLSPEEVVQELNECFMAFDNIVEMHGLEKIKTIGDAYMCAGNLPTPDPDHVFKIIRAAMEIQNFVESRNRRMIENGQEPWEVRIGVHVGPVVAGVVGRKKYAYDIWGSTVNIASRMESNGIPGKVNISADTYKLIGDRIHCTHRGKIYAKNLGELDMYFVDQDVSFPGTQVSETEKIFQPLQDEPLL